MGNGTSSLYLDTSWVNQIDGEWRSARARELDKLGGAERVAIKRGKSMQYRLDYLKDKLVEQGEAIEAALAKDPLAGRHEIIKQEHMKAARAGRNAQPHAKADSGNQRRHFSVREWQNMKHNELRALEQAEAAREQSSGGTAAKPTWNKLHWARTNASTDDKALIRDRMRDYYLNMEIGRRKHQPGKTQAIISAYAPAKPAPAVSSAPASDTKVKYAGWRLNVFNAKKTATQTLSVVAAFQTANGKRLARKRKPQRLDSFSFFIQDRLGADLGRFTEEAAKLGTHMAAAREAQQLVDELRRSRPQTSPQIGHGKSSEDGDAGGSADVDDGDPASSTPEASSSDMQGLGSQPPTPPPEPAPDSLPPRAGLQVHTPTHASTPLPDALTPALGTAPSDEPNAAGARMAPTPTLPTPASPRTAGAQRASPKTPTPPSSATRRAAATGNTPTPPSSATRRAAVTGKTPTPPPSAAPKPSAGTLDSRRHTVGAAALLRPATTDAFMGSRRRTVNGDVRVPPAFNVRKGLMARGKKDTHPPPTESTATTKASILGKGFEVVVDEVGALREAALMQALAKEQAAMERPSRMLTMYVNRCNAKWAEAATWDVPHIHNVARFYTEAAGGTANVFRSEVVNQLKQGKFVVQVLCSDESVVLSQMHNAFDLWSTDPWAVLSMLSPAKVAGIDKLTGVGMGPRLLMGLVNAVEAIGGTEAVAKLRVVLHVNESQEVGVMRDLSERMHLGLQPEHVIVVTQTRRNGYTYNQEAGRFERRPGTSLHQAGSGYCMMQLAWEGEGAWVDREGERHDLPTSVLDHLTQSGASWLITRRLRDLSLYNPTSTLDAESLAFSLFLHEANGANMMVEVETVNSLTGNGKRMPGVVFGHRNHESGADVTAQGTPLPARPKAANYYHSGPLPAVEVKMSDLQTPRMTSVIYEVKAKGKGKIVVSTRRYMWSLAILKRLLSTPAVFHTSLETAGEVCYLKFCAADLASAASAKCVALHNPRIPYKTISTATDLDDLQAAITAQDAHGGFRKLLGSTLPSREATMASQVRAIRQASTAAAAAAAAPGGTLASGSSMKGDPSAAVQAAAAARAEAEAKKTKAYPGNKIVVCCMDNPATQVAIQLLLSLLKPSRDLVMLVHVVSHQPGAERAGQELLAKLGDQVRAALVDVVEDVLLRTSTPLVEMVSAYVDEVHADLVVVGSDGLTGQLPVGGPSGALGGGFSRAVGGGGAGGMVSAGRSLGSVSLSLIKGLTRPTLLVKANAKNAHITWDKDKLKVMLAVDHGSRPLLKFVCGRVMNAVRGDRLLLVREAGQAGSQEGVTSRRLLENFSDIAASHHFHAVKRPVDGPVEDEGIKAADAEKVHIVAMQLPMSKTLPDQVLRALRATKSALLLYKQGAEG